MTVELNVKEYLDALNNGRLILYPSETLPSLGFHPRSTSSYSNLVSLKGRKNTQSFIGLVSSFEFTSSFWEPLPIKWKKLLEHNWPEQLSLVWKATSHCPSTLISGNGKVALRTIPKYSHSSLGELIESLALPLPTTSVNLTGQPASTRWDDAVRFAKMHSIYYQNHTPKFIGGCSTIIEISEQGFEVIRKGNYNPSLLKELL